jgi:hypothetical protein
VSAKRVEFAKHGGEKRQNSTINNQSGSRSRLPGNLMEPRPVDSYSPGRSNRDTRIAQSTDFFADVAVRLEAQ